MTRLSSSDLREQVVLAGVKYQPADTIFYSELPYKIELSPRFKGLGGVSGKRSCTINISNPVTARVKLAEFNDRMEKTICNVEYRQEICEFVARLPDVAYKTRMGGENSLFYFRDPELVILMVNRYKEVINSITGPLNSEHAKAIDKATIVLRDKLYFNKFRYYIEFAQTESFINNTWQQMSDFLQSIDTGKSRLLGIQDLIYYHHGHNNTYGHRYKPPTVAVYLEDPNDYVYAKLIAGQHAISNHEVRLFTEIDTQSPPRI
jgi:hypothetical protein